VPRLPARSADLPDSIARVGRGAVRRRRAGAARAMADSIS
jgi:hypothetical protein